MSSIRKARLKPLLERVPPGFLVDAAWLKKQGIDSKSIHGYVQRGWLERVVRGVYRRPLAGSIPLVPSQHWQLVLISLQTILGHDVHLGGLSALAWHGLAHDLSPHGDRRVFVYGSVPAWLARMPCEARFIVRSRLLLGDTTLGIENEHHELSADSCADQTERPLVSPWLWPLKVASPERAILEALDELPKHTSFRTLDMVFESLATLRPVRLMSLLHACSSVKVRRLFFVFADRHQHAWFKYLDKPSVDLGAGPRMLVKGDKMHPIYHISVPEELLPRTSSDGDVDG